MRSVAIVIVPLDEQEPHLRVAHHGVSTAKLKKSAFTYRDEAREEMI
jgi:hypothetical protein